MNREATLNQQIADMLRQAAALLEQQGANSFRVSAYSGAADTIAGLQVDEKGHTHDDRYLRGATARHGRDAAAGAGDP